MKPFATADDQHVGAYGEERLILSIKDWLGSASPSAPRGIGDDCCAIPTPAADRQILVTTDPVVYGTHFDDSLDPEQVGEKLLKRNISDVAAMGGFPRHAVVSLAAPESLSIVWLERFYKGLSLCAIERGVEINGGDVCSTSGFLGVFMTLVGFAPDRILERGCADAGADIYVTGSLGGSRSAKHFQFEPRLEEGLWLAERKERISCLDLSDGLGKDCPALVGREHAAVLYADRLPISESALLLSKSSGRSPIDHAINDGEDYELLFAVDRGGESELIESLWKQRFDTPLTRIGKVAQRREGEPAVRIASESDQTALTGYAHFREP